MASGTQGAKDMAANAADKARDMASHGADKAKDLASQAADKARDVASQAADKARDLASSAGRRADQMADKVGAGMTSAADTLREHSPDKGMLHTAASKVADTLESGGEYLKEEGLTGIADDLTNLIKRNPIPALLVGICLGALIARATRS
jgi:hypothetical protein